MKNILYIGHYKDNNGFGESSRRFINWLSNNIKLNLSIRPLFIINSVISKHLDSDQYIEYENNTNRKYDTLIQHTIPEYIEYHKDFGKNIAIVDIETLNIKHSGWSDKLNLMDEVWVGSKLSAESLLLSGVKTLIRIIPEPYNLEQYNKPLEDNFFSYDNDNKPFIFYTIGQYSEKKNIKSIILAYLLEFNKHENVRLFIKTCDHRKKNEDLEHIIKYDTSIIKNILRKPEDRYPDVDTVCGYLSAKDIVRLHKSADCYINTTKADGFGASAIEAGLCGNLVINTKNIGSSTYYNSTNALMVDSTETPVICSNSIIKNMYTMNESWFEPSINSIRNAMRKAHNLSNEQKQNLNNNFDKNIFSYQNINELLK
jgi:glycosyltransferase involved in cell wall biosynthesis